MARLISLCLLLSLGCSERRKIREWRPSDHDRSDEEGQVPAGEAAESGSEDIATAVVYRQNCASCHGRDGSGRTPQAAQMRIKDLRDSTMSEGELVGVIARGRARMPAFGQTLDADAIRALAKLVHGMRH